MAAPHDDRASENLRAGNSPAVAMRALAFLLTPVGALLGYTLFLAIMTTALGINLERSEQQNALYWLLLPMVVLGVFVPYTVTACAHLIMARSLGFRVDYFGIGPFQIYEDDRLRPRISNRWPTLSSYRVKSLGIGNGWKQNVTIYLFAGWISTALPLWVITPLWNRLMERNQAGLFSIETASSWELVYAFSLFFLTFGSWGWVLIFTIGGLIIPLRDLIIDRERVSHHLTHLDPPERKNANASTAGSADVLKRIHAVNQLAPEQSAVRPRDWDATEILALADDWTIQPPNVLMLLRAYYHILDRGEPAMASSYLVRAVTAVQNTNAVGHQRVLPEAAYFFARHRADLQSAEMYLRRGERSPATEHVYLRAEVAINLAREAYVEAEVKASEALVLLARNSPPGIAQAEREWLNALIEDSLARLDSRVVEDAS